jgi:hypothetical protein
MNKIHVMKIPSKIKSNKLHYFIFACLFLLNAGCITSFSPNLKTETGSLVVDGMLIKGLDTQVIKISRSTNIFYPENQTAQCPPVENCMVKIVDESGREFFFTEKSAGKYVAVIDDAMLTYNTRYKLEFTTSTGELYESDYQSIMKTTTVDSLYCIGKFTYNQEFDDTSTYGYQFYIDLNAPDDASKYYLWFVENTWEVHSLYKIFGYYDGENVITNEDLSDSLFHCWKMIPQTGIFTLSTTALSHNTVKRIPLHYLSGSALSMLGVLYCATVKQYAINKNVYEYWHEKEIELNESGQIYTTQPGQVKSNVYNTQRPDEKVLGYFWASSCSLKRLFCGPGESGQTDYVNPCSNFSISSDLSGYELEKLLLLYINNYKLKNKFPNPPVYIYQVCSLFGCTYHIALSNDCIDCRLQNATLKKPDFWDEHETKAF